MMSSGVNLVMTVIGFAVSTMFIVFVCTRLICARIQLNASRRSVTMASRSDLSMLERGLHGLEPYVLANFPTKKYNDSHFASGEKAQCTVCLAEYHGEDILRFLPFCGHSFHAACIDIWLHHHSTCPVCRVSLREHSEKKRFMHPVFGSSNQSQYTAESQIANSFQCTSTGDRFPSRLPENQRMDPIQEAHCQSEHERVEAGDGNSNLTGGSQITKYSGNKQAESPSNV